MQTSVPLKILLVDDNDPILRMFTQVLTQMGGHEVVACENGQKGLETFLSQNFDLVVTDWEMPVLDGAGMIRAIKTASPETLILFTSGRAGETGFKALAAELGVTQTLEKPCRPKHLLDAIAGMTAGMTLLAK